MSEQQYVVEAIDLKKEYPDSSGEPVVALDGVSLGVKPGELLAIVGPSGSGKSTLLQLLGLLDTPTSGRVLLNGSEASGFNERQRTALRRDHLGFVFQEFHLVPSMSVLENVALSAIVANQPSRKWRARAVELLERLDLIDLSTRYPNQISGGQRQRVAIARALYQPPQLVLADEPTGNLDSSRSAAVLTMIREAIGATTGAAGVLVTHDLHAASYADRVLAVVDGQLHAELQLSGNPDGGEPTDVERVRTWMASISV